MNLEQQLMGHGKIWQKKAIRPQDIVTDDMNIVLETYRDWMLGGQHMEWCYHKDKITGDLVLERR